MTNKQIVPFENLKELVTTETTRKQFEQILGDRAPSFIASVINTVYLDDNLRDCEPNSILAGALKAAVLDLPIEPSIGYAYLVPYREKNTRKARFQIGYRGYIQLCIRTGLYEAINAIAVYEGETVRENRITGEIELEGAKRTDEVTGYISYFRLKTGYEKFMYMTKQEIEAHAAKFSESYGKDWSPWTKHFDQMARKTMLRLIISRYGVMTTRMTNVILQSEEIETIEEDAETIDARMRDIEEHQDHPEQTPEISNGRPYEPEVVRQKINEIVEYPSYKDYEASDAQRNLLRYGLELCFAGEDKKAVDDKRHTVLNFLADNPSTREVSGPRVKALLDKWLGITKDEETGDYFINPAAAAEAQRIYSESIAEEGQKALL